jgi:hypothetical protein
VPDQGVLGVIVAIAAVVFLLIGAILTIVQRSTLQERGWSFVRGSDVAYPSVLALGRMGVVQVINFAVLGLGLLAAAAGFLETVGFASILPAALLGFASLAAVALMAPTDGSVTRVMTRHGAIHLVAFVVLLVAIVLAMLAVGWVVLGVQSLSWLGAPSITAAIVVLALTGLSFVVPAVGGLASVLSIVAMLGWLALAGIALAGSL